MPSNSNASLFQNTTNPQAMVDQFGLANFPWGGTIVDEPVLVTHKPMTVKLWRDPTSIIRVLQYSTGQAAAAANNPAARYVNGVDYIMTADGIHIPANSAIPVAPANFIDTPSPTYAFPLQAKKKDGSPMRLEEDYALFQIAVMYNCAPFICPEANPLGRLAAALQSHTPYFATVFGDSIDLAGNTSGQKGWPPYQPGWVDMFFNYLSTASPGTLYWRNKSIAGLTSGQAALNTHLVLDTPQDLMVLPLQMNDSAGNIIKEGLKGSTDYVMNAVLQQYPQTEFMLYTGATSNPEWINHNPKFHGYRQVKHELAGKYQGMTNVAVIDFMTMFEQMLTRKRYCDISANGANHFEDFIHQCMAKVAIWNQLGASP